MTSSKAPELDNTVKGKMYTRTRRHKIRYPKNFDPTRASMTVPDPHRWLPRSQRPGQSRRKAQGASYIKGPQGLISSEAQKPLGPSTAHIEVGGSSMSGISKKKGRK